jgi:universal stress protein E
MQKLERILVVVDPGVDQHPCVEKASALALACDAEVELFACDPGPSGGPSYLDDLESPTEAAASYRDDLVRKLQALAGGLRRQHTRVGVEVALEKPLYQGILAKIARSRPDLVIKDTHYHSPLRRAFFTNTDWHLIREAPTPLLLVKPATWTAAGARLLAAIDPMHKDDKPAVLDHEILETTEFLKDRLRGAVVIVHAFDALYQAAVGMGIGEGAIDAPMAADLIQELRTERQYALEEIAAEHGFAGEAVELVDGSPADVLPVLASAREADIVVMGAIARGPAFNFFIGSTAERVLDRLPCDALVVKPPPLAERLWSEIPKREASREQRPAQGSPARQKGGLRAGGPSQSLPQ